jgi:hypothetical protein
MAKKLDQAQQNLLNYLRSLKDVTHTDICMKHTHVISISSFFKKGK